MKLAKLSNCYKFIKSRRAFSLLELSVILTAASIVVVGSMYLSEYNEVGDKYQETEQKIQSIETAILAYYKKNGYFPCPADLTINIKELSAGDSQDVAGDDTSCDTSLVSSDGDFYVGAVPTNELGLSYEYMLDAWGNKFSLIIPKIVDDVQASSSDSFFSTPENYSNLLFWLDANDESLITKDSSDIISRIEDKGSNNYDFIQNTSSYRPKYVLDGNYPAIQFDGINDRLFINTKYYNSAYQIPYLTSFVVYNTSSQNKQIFVSYDGGEYWRAALDNSDRFEFKTGDPNLWLRVSSSGYRDGNIHIYTIRYSMDTLTKEIFINGDLLVSSYNSALAYGLGSGVTRYGYIGVGSEASYAGGGVNSISSYVLGNIYEVIVYENALTESQLDEMHDYLENKWQNGYAYLGASSSSTSFLNINDVNGSVISDEGAFSIISYGASGDGAYAKSGVQNSNLPTYNNLESGFDSQSIVTDYMYVDSILTKWQGFGNDFNQIVRFKTLDDMSLFDE